MMRSGEARVFRVEEESGVGEARRAAVTLARVSGFDEVGCGRVAIVVTEAARNLVRHGGGGEVLVTCIVAEGGTTGLDIHALDHGTGMGDLQQCLQDGYSSVGSAGEGLGAIARLSAGFDLFSRPRQGTALLSRLWAGEPPLRQALEVGAVSVPYPGEMVRGDGWAVVAGEGRLLAMVADGIGHGPQAAAAARLAEGILVGEWRRSPGEILTAAHAALRPTRGAALAVTEVVPGRHRVRFAGLGNVTARIEDRGQSRLLVSLPGTAGHEARTVREFEYPWPAHALLVMHTDGLATRWGLDQYPGVATRLPGLAAGLLYRDHRRGKDDVTVLVAREVEAPK
ncbi:MAG TPA: SpoIIE family protein phosphatase [Anaeromyxobacter sp.]|nr:SpoIIE family protein phosphatase [Anaeromyxobacter sp.]